MEGGLDGIRESTTQIVLEYQPVHDDGDVVLELLVEHDLVFEEQRLAVDLDAREALTAKTLKDVLELALATAHDRRIDGELGALRQTQNLVHDLLGALSGDGAPALGAVRMADACVEQAQVIVDLGDRPDGRARIPRRGLLVDRNRGRQPVDAVDVGLLHLSQELACVGAEGFDVASLPLRVQGVERQARFAGARQPRDTDELVARQLDRDVLEVVLARTSNRDRLLDGHPSSLIARPAEPAAWSTRRDGRAGTCRW